MPVQLIIFMLEKQGHHGSYAKYGGWNGGGGIINSYNSGGNGDHIGTGGGATDICTVYSEITTNQYRYIRTNNSYNSRIIVAGGGGGAEGTSGQYGGGQNGGSYGGTQSACGTTNINDASSWVSLYSGGLGYGSSTSGGHTNHAMGACGGGGYYGGGAFANNGSGAYGGGGSGYVSSTLTNAQTIAGNQNFTAPGGGTETGHAGNGYAKITRIS